MKIILNYFLRKFFKHFKQQWADSFSFKEFNGSIYMLMATLEFKIHIKFSVSSEEALFPITTGVGADVPP